MPLTDIGEAVASDLKTAFGPGTDNYFQINSETTDGPTDQKETRWNNINRSKWLGFFKKVGILKRVINAKATWTVGKGFKSDPDSTRVLDSIKGIGKDTFNTILENMIRDMQISGDAYCEIIRDEDGELINLKPLDPENIEHIANQQGIIIRYEQISKNKEPNKKFRPDQIFHLMRNRIADEIHGDSLIDSLEDTINMRSRAKEDWDRVLHHNVDPMIVFKLDTDNTAKIAAFKALVDATKGKGDNMYIPKDTVEFEIISLAPNANLNPLPWIEVLDNDFHQESGVPRIIVGGSGGFTDASVKIAYLAFQQTIEEDQLFIEEQVGMQLGIAIELEFPASLEGDLLSDQAKDKTNGAAKPSDVQA